MSLNEKIIALARGDKSAFDEVYEQTKKTVYYIALSVLKDRALAEDGMQQTYLQVIRYAGQYKEGTNPKAWIGRIARNVAINMKKKREREIFVDEQEAPTVFGVEHTSDYGLLVELAKSLLPEEEFAILMLVTAEGYKRREIAQMLGMPLATVTWKYGRAIKTMQKALREGGKEK